MASEYDFISLGKHCSVPDCHRLDFLPFKCDKCSKLFCVEHRTASEHRCINQEIGDTRIPQCPLCNQFIKISKHQTINDQVEAHIMSGCKELVLHDSSKRSHLNMCMYKSCKRYELVPITCPSCNKIYCIKHRHEGVHTCSNNNSLALVKVN